MVLVAFVVFNHRELFCGQPFGVAGADSKSFEPADSDSLHVWYVAGWCVVCGRCTAVRCFAVRPATYKRQTKEERDCNERLKNGGKSTSSI